MHQKSDSNSKNVEKRMQLGWYKVVTRPGHTGQDGRVLPTLADDSSTVLGSDSICTAPKHAAQLQELYQHILNEFDVWKGYSINELYMLRASASCCPEP